MIHRSGKPMCRSAWSRNCFVCTILSDAFAIIMHTKIDFAGLIRVNCFYISYWFYIKWALHVRNCRTLARTENRCPWLSLLLLPSLVFSFSLYFLSWVTLLENRAFVPVGKGLLSRFSSRDKASGTKGGPFCPAPLTGRDKRFTTWQA